MENIALLLEGCGRFLLRWDGGGGNKDKDGKESKEKDSKDGAGAAGKDIGLGLGGIQEQGEGIRERFGKMVSCAFIGHDPFVLVLIWRICSFSSWNL